MSDEHNQRTSSASHDVSREVALRTMRERRRRIWRNMLTVVAGLFVMLVLLIINRDSQAVRACEGRMRLAAERMRASLADERLPIGVLLRRGEDSPKLAALRDHVYPNLFYTTQMRGQRLIGLCCCARPHKRMLLADGRYVILFDTQDKTFHVEWMDESEFQQRARQLGLDGAMRTTR